METVFSFFCKKDQQILEGSPIWADVKGKGWVPDLSEMNCTKGVDCQETWTYDLDVRHNGLLICLSENL